MLRSNKVQMIAVLAIGCLLGYTAASGKLDVFGTGNAAPPSTPVADPKGQAAVAKAGYVPDNPSQYHPDQTLRVLVATRKDSGDGYAKKAFFFVGLEIQRQQVDPGARFGVVPTLKQRQGDFSEFLTPNGQNLRQSVGPVLIPGNSPNAGSA